MRDGHLYDAAKLAVKSTRAVGLIQAARQWKDWATGVPWAKTVLATGRPPYLDEWDSSLGKTRVANLLESEPTSFKHTLSYHQGDMIGAAEVAAQMAPVGHTVAVLNMANSRHVGGGFLSGARAQEEQLCHRSDLFLRLRVAEADGLYPIQPGSALVTPRVSMLRGGPPNFDELDVVNEVGVVSVAATHFRSEQEALSDSNLETSLTTAWRAVIDGARDLGASVLIVSALGAGAFNNPPDVVGKCLIEALCTCHPGDRLNHIAVIVLDDHNSNSNVQRMRVGMHTAAERTGLFRQLEAFDGFDLATPTPPPPGTKVTPPGSANAPMAPTPPPLKPFSEDDVSDEARRLQKAQLKYLIPLNDVLSETKGTRYQKTETHHWAWYVFPTIRTGFKDRNQTAVKNVVDVIFLMRYTTNVDVWSMVLTRLANAISLQKTRNVLPFIDHGRVTYFLTEWSTPEYQAAVAVAPEFVEAFNKFKAAWLRNYSK